MKNRERKTSKSVRDIARSADTRRLRNDTQRALLVLARAEGEWVSRKQLARTVKSPGSRVRDLRTHEYGSLDVQCATALELGRPGDSHTTFYRLVNPSVQKVEKVLVKGVVLRRPR